ncbi:MAG: ribulose-phosphate 3-epimerase, partial [Clostridia bacterium]|nr:ribulose-phosphate 3-epimerase [Clostridia bacterium]
MAIIAPSILSADYMNFQRDMEATKEAGAKWFHVDIMDGHFVPNLSFGYSWVKAMRPLTDLVLDVHLMIETPIK